MCFSLSPAAEQTQYAWDNSRLMDAVALSIYTLYSKFVAQRYNTWAALAYGMLSVSLLLLVVFPPSIKIFDGFPYNIALFLLYLSFLP